jgi:hypothetical protein
VKASDYIIPHHPYQLVIAANESLGISKSRLDKYVKKNFGKRWSEMLFENQYSFIVEDWKAVKRATSEAHWRPSDANLGSLPLPQLVYAYNSRKFATLKQSEDATLQKMQMAQLTKVGADIAEDVTSSKKELLNEMDRRETRTAEITNARITAERHELIKFFQQNDKNNREFLLKIADKFTESNKQVIILQGAMMSQYRLGELKSELSKVETELILSQDHAQNRPLFEKKRELETDIEIEKQQSKLLTTTQLSLTDAPPVPASPSTIAGVKRSIESIENGDDSEETTRSRQQSEMIIDVSAEVRTKLTGVVNSVAVLSSTPRKRAYRAIHFILSFCLAFVALASSIHKSLKLHPYLYPPTHPPKIPTISRWQLCLPL